jgi:hypothetical protein
MIAPVFIDIFTVFLQKSNSTQLKENAHVCKAARLDRVPKLVAAILRLLDGGGLLGKNLMVADTRAMYAYEAAAGVSGSIPKPEFSVCDEGFRQSGAGGRCPRWPFRRRGWLRRSNVRRGRFRERWGGGVEVPGSGEGFRVAGKRLPIMTWWGGIGHGVGEGAEVGLDLFTDAV